MPPRTKADAYVNDPATTLEQLQVAAELLGLDATGDAEALRIRLNMALGHYSENEEVVCLNPNTVDDAHH